MAKKAPSSGDGNKPPRPRGKGRARREAEYRAMFELSSVGFGQSELETGRYLRVNRKLCEMTGYSPEELLQMTVSDLNHPDDRARDLAIYQRLIKGEMSEWTTQKRYVRKDGRVIWVEVAGTVIHMPDTPPYAVVSVQDITARKQAEEDAAHRISELSHVHRLTLAGELASGLAHEINQPLCTIANYTRSCIRRLQAGDTDVIGIIEDLERTAAQAERAGDIVRGLRELVLSRPPRLSPLRISGIIERALQLMLFRVRRLGVNVETELAGEQPLVQGDPIHLELVVINLLRNALDAMSDQPAGRRNLLVRTALLPSKQVRVIVRDSGGGLGGRCVEELFRPFFTTKPRGMGVGLSISRSIIEAHRGRIWGLANPEGGMSFGFDLPLL